MKTNIWFRRNKNEEWRKVFGWTNLPEDWAHKIADRYNEKHDYGMWWVSKDKPGKEKVTENFT